ncbi:MAG: ATP-dependent helicase HrpB, partial [Myxococcales bacterium]|nr:ATP-dependent helicase HrpB [Myxococcales bacterium]
PPLDLPTLPELQPAAEVSPPLEAHRHAHRGLADLRRLDLHRWLQGWLGHGVVQTVDRLAPTHLPLPDGTRGRLTYAPGQPPVLAAQLQRLFGLTETPRVAGGKAPVLLHLLAPNQRPTQITADLASFWANGYPEVRKQLRGRYPKHRWPEDPLTAEPGVRRPR